MPLVVASGTSPSGKRASSAPNAHAPLAPSGSRWLLLALLSVFAIALHGYHPYVVDASIYVTGIEKSINPALYTQDGGFVSSHARLSAFSWLMARLQIATSIPLPWLLLLAYLGLVFFLLAGGYLLGRRIFKSEAAGWGAALLMSACLPLPVAATSLLIVDPYLTARSFSTPLTLFTLLACIERRWLAALAAALLATLFHPLMGVYLAGFVLTYLLASVQQWRLLAFGAGSVFVACATLQFATRHDPIVGSYREAVLSRSYYFPTVWHWYEIIGLVAPSLLFSVVWRRTRLESELSRLAATCALVGTFCTVCCLCLVHPGGPYVLARLQLLRSFHTIYLVGTILLGAAVAARPERAVRVTSIAMLACVMAGMFLLQRQTYSTLANIELPGIVVLNPWERGFLWIREQTPPNAVFATDPALADGNDEAMPGFRAMTLRSTLTDLKDEGLASLFPALAPLWDQHRREQAGLGSLDDTGRERQLVGSGANWLLLGPSANTHLHCPYQNRVMKVCSLGHL